MKNEQNKNQELLDKYVAQTAENEDIHFEHVDWVYSDSSCCC